MNSYRRPPIFDGGKFALRYGIDSLAGAFWADETMLYLRDGLMLPDDPPIFELPDPPKPSIQARLDGATNLPDLIVILKEVLL